MQERILQVKTLQTTSSQKLKERIETFAKDKMIHAVEFDNITYQGDSGLELIHMAKITYEDFPF